MKFSDHVIPQMSVKFHTVFSQILILFLRIGNTGIQIQYSLQLQHLLQCMVQFPANPHFPAALIHINRCFHTPVIGLSVMKNTYIGRRAYYTDKTALESETYDALWNILTAGAVSTVGQQ